MGKECVKCERQIREKRAVLNHLQTERVPETRGAAGAAEAGRDGERQQPTAGLGIGLVGVVELGLVCPQGRIPGSTTLSK
jgi:hypothetical protein